MSLPLAHDYRFDPFSNVSTAVNITHEEHVIPSSSPFTISLHEIPKHDSPSTLSIKVKDLLAVAITTSGATSITVTHGAWFAVGNTITIDSEQMYVSRIASNVLTVTRGYNSTTATTHSLGAAVYIESSMTEVESTPTAGQFWADYSTGADGQSDWNTGTLLFNSADTGKTVVVSYVGTGTLVAVEKMRALHRCDIFTSSGTWMCPEGVEHVNILLIGGGGGGAGNHSAYDSGSRNGGDGGASSFGALITAGGGQGARRSATPSSAGSISESSNFLILKSDFRIGTPGTKPANAGHGNDATGHGNGGGNANGDTGSASIGSYVNTAGSAGSSASYGSAAGGGALYAVAVPVSAGTSYTITIGAGGIGYDYTYDGGDGAPGLCVIWY